MGWATYLTASPKTLDGYYRTEALADARITAAAAESPVVTLSKHGSATYRLPDDAQMDVWEFDDTDNDFVDHVLTDSEQLRAWKDLLAEKAKMLDNAIHQHWANMGRANGEFDATPYETDSERLNNTFDWGRVWIGVAWMEILKMEGNTAALNYSMVDGSTAALSDMDAVKEVVDQAFAELSNSDHIYFWYRAHSTPAIWRAYLDARQIYKTNANGSGTVFNATRYSGLSTSTWAAMVVTYFQVARDWAAGIGVS